MTDQVAHVYPQLDVAYSVLYGAEITAPCGDVRVMTRESVDSAADKPICLDCVSAVDAEIDDYKIHGARGWVAYLERIVKAALGAPDTEEELADGN